MNIDVPDCVGALTQHKLLPNILAVPWKTADHLALTIELGLLWLVDQWMETTSTPYVVLVLCFLVASFQAVVFLWSVSITITYVVHYHSYKIKKFQIIMATKMVHEDKFR